MKLSTAISSFLLVFFVATINAQTTTIEGTWHVKEGDTEHTLVLVDGYLSYSIFDVKNKKFINTSGGPYSLQGDKLKVNVEFNAQDKSDVGGGHVYMASLSNTLKTNISGKDLSWTKIDDNNAPLSGVWRITGRQVNDKMNEMPLRDRRTLKILSGTRFQWIAINIKTGEFSGTGGGTYTFDNNKYTEHIEFFSRDNDRVGASLSFDGKIENGQWHHSGASSKGDPIYEIWSKMYK
ncbi:membrane or secreted protein [Olivibacter sp. SDN3]|uniref:membrane or secreted protein n=1 Tax=Olivibacter sp. SDN3 TaxID=2764720 RepID=UPI001651AD09|nr:membrane or secreted protein [Olivibacter sp. SDN3]QNL48441.1 membrane or secreted protein [Olivibacter sp. SDN3]